jgi:hypothetical protein
MTISGVLRQRKIDRRKAAYKKELKEQQLIIYAKRQDAEQRM